MIGLDTYVGTKASFVGIDWLNLTSSALKSAGGLASGDDKSKEQKALEEQKKALEEQKKAAEASVTRWKWIGAGAAVAALLAYLALRRARAHGGIV